MVSLRLFFDQQGGGGSEKFEKVISWFVNGPLRYKKCSRAAWWVAVIDYLTTLGYWPDFYIEFALNSRKSVLFSLKHKCPLKNTLHWKFLNLCPGPKSSINLFCAWVFQKRGPDIEKLRGSRGGYNRWTEQQTFNYKWHNIVINPITRKGYRYFWKLHQNSWGLN